MSGKFATMGIPARDGTILAVEKINRGGGVCGRSINLIIKDDGGEPSASLERARELSNLGVRYIIGPLTSACGSAVIPFINSSGILTISPTTTSESLADRKDLFIKFSPKASDYGQHIALDASRFENGTWVVLRDSKNRSFCDSFVKGLDMAFAQMGMDPTRSVEFDSSAKISYRELARQTLDLDPEGVIFCTASIDAAILSQHLKRSRPDLRLYSSEWAISKSLIENGGQFVEGLVFFSVMNFSDSSEKYRNFLESYRDRFGNDPTLAAMNYYETVDILSKAFGDDCSVTDPVSLADTIIGRDIYHGLQRDFRFDSDGDAMVPLMKHTIEDGEFVKVP
jgi:branched-chain amino acid transport system substrate-binding protein